MMKVVATIAVLLFIIVISVEAIDEQYPGFQVILPPISYVSNHPYSAGAHNRWNRNLRVCGKTPRWFLSDVAQCVETPSGTQMDCYYMGWQIPLTYKSSSCQTTCCCDGDGDPISCCSCSGVNVNGYCYYGSSAYNGRYMPNFNEIYYPYTGPCLPGITNPSTNCDRVRDTSFAVMTIEGGQAIGSTLPLYVQRSGVRVEIDLAYGFASSNGQTSPIGGNSDIRVDIYIAQGTTASTSVTNDYKQTQLGARHGVTGSSDDPIEGVIAYSYSNYLSSCDTITFNLPNAVLAYGSSYSIYLQFYNANDGSKWWADAGRNWGTDIAVSSIRVYEGTGVTGSLVPCYVSATTTANAGQADSIQRQASYLSEYLPSYGFTDANPYNCDLCSINSGRGYCTADTQAAGTGGQAKFIDASFDINLSGVSATGGYLILYGANFDDNNDLTLIVNGNTWFSKKKSTVNAAPVNGIYYFCSNCQAMVWPFDNVQGVKTTGNGFQIYTSGEENLCVAGYQFVFTTKDATPPSNIATSGFCKVNSGVHTYTLSPSQPKITSTTLTVTDATTLAWYYTPHTATDNCETYTVSDVVPVSLSITYLDVWDYEINYVDHTTQVLTVQDHSGNTATCKSYVNINLSPAMINYPPSSSTISITNIIIRWENYTPILDGTTTVKIWLVPNGGCPGGSPTVVLGDNLSYLLFQYYYRGPTKDINVTTGGCNYNLNVQFTDGTGKHDPILFRQTSITFVDLNAPIS